MSVSASIVVDNDFNSLWVSFSEEEVLLHRHFRALEQEMEVHNSEYKGPSTV